MHRKEENHFRPIYDAATARLSAVRRIAGDAFDTIAALQRWPTAWRFAFAIAIVVVAEAIRFTLLGALGERLVYVTLYPAVTVAALVSGLYGGTLATIVAAFLAHLLVAPLRDAGDFVGLATFLVSGLVVSAMAEALQSARSSLAEVEASKQHELEPRHFIEQAPIAIAMFDREMRYIAVNVRWKRDYRLEEDLIGRSHYDVFPEIPERWKEFHCRGLAGEVLQANEDRFERQDGSVQWLHWKIHPWYRAEGDVGGIIIFAEEITHYKVAQEALRIERDKLQAVIDNVDVGISFADPSGTFLLLNEAAQRIYGMASPSELLTLRDREHYFELRCPDGKIVPLDEWPARRAMRGEHVRDYDADLIRRDTGVRHNIRFSAVPIRDDGGQVILCLVSMTDLTKLKLAESSLRDSATLQDAIVNTAVDSIVVIDDSGIIQSANPATQAIFNYSTGELIGQNVKMLMPQEVARAHDGYLSSYKRTGVRKIIGIGREVLGKRRDGSTFPVDLAVAEWHDATGRRFYTGIMRDISERKKIEEALSHAQRLDAVGRLAGGVAHDINNLLAVIAGNLEVAEQRTEDQETNRLIRRAMEAVEAGTGFNRRLLSLAQRRKLEPRRLVLNTRVEHMLKLLERTLGEEIELNAKLATDLWDVHCDPGEVDGAIVNLAINARDAMPDGGRLVVATCNVTLDASRLHPDARQGDYVRVSVVDTGIGMTPEVLKHAMDPFFSTKDPGKGTGLGLSSVYNFVKQSGGFVTLASEPGKGTTVSLYLPRASSDPVTKHAAGAEDIPPGNGELILVVEDDDRVREITLKRLESLGYAVAEARSGPEAIKLLKSGEPVDLVFSDVVMPGNMTGYDVAQWVATMKPNVKVVLATGYDSKSNAPAASTNITVLDKPYTRERLAQIMRSALLDQTA
jgi:PAS domain S-box-containing protein